jgi:hypothetical protein
MDSHQKYEKLSYDIGIEVFLRLHLNPGEKFRFLRMLNSAQNRILAARDNFQNS